MKKYKCIVTYDGSNYAGFQVQKNSKTIQSTLQDAFFRRFQKKIDITGSSRTDAGVHALGQVVHFEYQDINDISRTMYQINAILPKDIRILSMEEVNMDFHSRYAANKKTYYYYLNAEQPVPPFGGEYVLSLSKNIDINLMIEASSYFLGTHDFRAFAHQANIGCAKNKPVKTIYRLDWIKEPYKYRVEIEGNGFLHKMVRNIIGTLIDVGMKKILPSDIPLIIESKDRTKAGQTAPANALFLARIDY